MNTPTPDAAINATIYYDNGTSFTHTQLLDNAKALRKAFLKKKRITIVSSNGTGAYVDMAKVTTVLLEPYKGVKNA